MKRKNVIGIIVPVVLALALLAALFLYQGKGTSDGASTREDGSGSSDTATLTNNDTFGQRPGQAGWLSFAGAAIDDPVMIAQDNDYYLRRDENGSDNVWGCYFMDYECTPASRNIIVYGHSLEDSAYADRFSKLKYLNDDEFAAQNNILELTVLDTKCRYRIFSHGYVSAVLDTLPITANPTDAEMKEIVEEALARSAFDYGTEVTAADDLLTLSTCTSDDSMRFVVVAKRVE